MDIGVNYTAHSGPRNTCDGIKQIFYCRRSGVKSTKIHGKRQRAEKRQASLAARLSLIFSSVSVETKPRLDLGRSPIHFLAAWRVSRLNVSHKFYRVLEGTEHIKLI
ncbi:hypothetical protein GWK47_018991 [Chionoecetes opilio]|uniref:Uncharacterized protein n=1 Tax=Chionoecetes opilio TaxID=41210 RepID=A0A8J4XUW3_CHIOP|nr:hypothetical protein GWK47_018991 [Chionoecetes opilio]